MGPFLPARCQLLAIQTRELGQFPTRTRIIGVDLLNRGVLGDERLVLRRLGSRLVLRPREENLFLFGLGLLDDVDRVWMRGAYRR